MFRGKYFTSLNSTGEEIAVREQIPEFACGSDGYDNMAFYAVVYDEEDKACGTGRLYIDDDSAFRIDFLGILPEYRGRYMGDLLARMLLYKAQELNAASVRALVPKELTRFFARYGFISQNNDAAQTEMRVDGDKIRLEGSCSKGKGQECAGNCENCK